MSQDEVPVQIVNDRSFLVQFKPEYLNIFSQVSAKKIALLFTNEYEGIFKNGGIGTYYKNLSQKLTDASWYVVLIICGTSTENFDLKNSSVKHTFFANELEKFLDLQPIQQKILSEVKQNAIDYTSFCCLFTVQAFTHVFQNSLVLTEFHEMNGIGYRTIQAQQSSLLGNNCITAVTLHSGHEWLNEANKTYAVDCPSQFWHICHYEQYSFENADLAFFPSYYLKSKVASYGWKTSHALHLPLFIPIVESTIASQNERNSQAVSERQQVPIVFFGRLEERKGLLVFIEAIKLLNIELKQQINIIFLGKVIQLQSSELKHLNSQQYIEKELKNEVSYSIVSDLYSKEAIEFVNQLVNPIVCLTSAQENFPNSALEMGQLPVRLVASDTGGFREALELINRVAVYWFRPQDSRSLADVMETAFLRPEKAQIPTRNSLFQINQSLLARKLELVEQVYQKQNVTTHIQPKVTIGVTCYNLGKYLLECLHSIDRQTYQNLEVIIIDDASTDPQTQEILQRSQSLFPQFKFIRASVNLGLGAARNRLVELAEGEYFIPLDADNIALPFMVEKFVLAATKSNAAIVGCTMMGFGDVSGILVLTGGLLPTMLKENCCGDACSLFSTKILRKFKHPESREVVAHDWQIITAAAATQEKIAYYPYPLYLYRVRLDSMLRKNPNLERDRYHLRQYLSQVEPSEYSRRQIYMLLTAVQQLQLKLQQVKTESDLAIHALWQEKGELDKAFHNLWQEKGQLDRALHNLWQEKEQLEKEKIELSKYWKLKRLLTKLKCKIGLIQENS